MAARYSIAVLLLAASAAGACTSATGPQLPAGAAPVESSGAKPLSPPANSADPVATTVLAKATPTEIYELVARGALGCWFGAGGPLKASHVFHAEAAPPAEGGAAEIMLHERDASFRDQRGPRAFRVTFAAAPGGARVDVANIKMSAAAGEAMLKDVEVWVGGGAGCQLRILYPPAPPPVAEKTKPKAKGKTSTKAGNQP